MLMYRLCNMCKPLDELPVVPHQAQEGSDFSVSLGWSKLCHYFSIPFARLHALLRDMMDHIVNLILKEFALMGFSLRLCSQ